MKNARQIISYFLCTLVILCSYKNMYTESITSQQQQPAAKASLTEDLMSEHGILNRILLIYDELVRRMTKHLFDCDIDVLRKAATIIKTFIEDFHEKLEEDYIFPIFEKNKKELRLIKTLTDQHAKGRKLTNLLLKLSVYDPVLDHKDLNRLRIYMQKFIRMYRPHESREDTILFPQVRSLISQKEFEELSEKFEKLEKQLFGENAFERIVREVEELEKKLGIYQLQQFTPTNIH